MRPSRITVVDMISFQADGEQPKGVQSRFERWLKSDDDLFTRRIKLTEEWSKLDTGGVAGVGMLVIENLPVKFAVQPTNEERQAALAKIVELSYRPGPAEWFILPGESMRSQPANVDGLWIRCSTGEHRCIVHLFPA